MSSIVKLFKEALNQTCPTLLEKVCLLMFAVTRADIKFYSSTFSTYSKYFHCHRFQCAHNSQCSDFHIEVIGYEDLLQEHDNAGAFCA